MYKDDAKDYAGLPLRDAITLVVRDAKSGGGMKSMAEDSADHRWADFLKELLRQTT